MTSAPTSPTAPAARAVDLRKTYGAGDSAVHALAGVSLDLEAGRFTVMVGASAEDIRLRGNFTLTRPDGSAPVEAPIKDERSDPR